MHFYLFDSFLADPKYKKNLDEIESRILDLDIGGRSFHLTALRDFDESLKMGLQEKYTTIVIVGNDRTLTKTFNTLAGQNKPLGIIPIGDNLEICQTLGLPKEVDAVDVIANRLVNKINLGVANKKYFISSAKGKDNNFIINCDGQFDVEIKAEQNMDINNLFRIKSPNNNSDEDTLELLIYSHKKSFFGKDKIKFDSLFRHRNLIIKTEGESAPIILDNHEVLKTPVNLSVLKNGLNLIVGRERKF